MGNLRRLITMANQTSKHSERIPLLLTPELLKQIDDWRFAHRIASRGEAIRQLVVMGLKVGTGDGR
jgi:hypothetical protein